MGIPESAMPSLGVGMRKNTLGWLPSRSEGKKPSGESPITTSRVSLNGVRALKVPGDARPGSSERTNSSRSRYMGRDSASIRYRLIFPAFKQSWTRVPEAGLTNTMSSLPLELLMSSMSMELKHPSNPSGRRKAKASLFKTSLLFPCDGCSGRCEGCPRAFRFGCRFESPPGGFLIRSASMHGRSATVKAPPRMSSSSVKPSRLAIAEPFFDSIPLDLPDRCEECGNRYPIGHFPSGSEMHFPPQREGSGYPRTRIPARENGWLRAEWRTPEPALCMHRTGAPLPGRSRNLANPDLEGSLAQGNPSPPRHPEVDSKSTV